MKTFPLFKVHIPTEDALANVREVFTSGYINEGTQVTQLTQELKKLLDAENLILTNSCTSALTLALRLAGVGPGDDVVSTPMTCVATNTPIVASGAKIVWADVNWYDGMLNPGSVQQVLTSKTKAVIAVAWAGTPPARLAELHELCRSRNVKLILDAAHAFQTTYLGAPVHCHADLTTYSFQAIKHFTTGDGGSLVCACRDDHERAKALKWFGLDRERAKDAKGDWKGQQWDVDIEEAGYKFNMNNVAAAIGLAQVPHANRIVAIHRRNAMLYDKEFDGWGDVQPNAPHGLMESSHWVYAMRVGSNSRLNRDELLRALNAEGIMAGIVHVPNDEYTCFKEFKRDLLGVRRFAAHQFALPCGWWLNADDIAHIASRVKTLVSGGT